MRSCGKTVTRPPPECVPMQTLSRRLFPLLIAAISFLALWPQAEQLPSTGWDKANHALAFATLMVVWLLGWPRARWAWGALGLLAYGGLIELLQSQLPPRSGEWEDLAADAVGLLLGLLLGRRIHR